MAYTSALVRHVTFFHAVSENSSHLHAASAGHHFLLIAPGLLMSQKDVTAHVHPRSWIFHFKTGEGQFRGALQRLLRPYQRKMAFCTLLMRHYQSQLRKLCMFYKAEK